MNERKDIKEGVASELTKFFCKTGVYLKKGRAGLVHYSKLLTIKSDVSLLKSDKRVIYRKLGEEAYKAIKEGRIDLPESKVTIERIDRLEDSIKEKTDEIERLGQEGHSLEREKEIVKIKEEREVQEKPSVPIKIPTPENKKTDVSEKLEQEGPSLRVEEKSKETKEEVEIKEKKEETAQKRPSKPVRKTTSGEKKKTRKTTKENTKKKVSPKTPAVAKKDTSEVKKKAGKTTVKRTVKKKEIKKEDKKS